MGRIILPILLLFTIPCSVNAECVEGAMTVNKYTRVNSHTIALTGGYDGAIVVRTDCKIKRNSEVEILKDTFCDEDKAVLYIDGKNCDAEKVSRDDKFNADSAFGDYNWDYDVN